MTNVDGAVWRNVPLAQSYAYFCIIQDVAMNKGNGGPQIFSFAHPVVVCTAPAVALPTSRSRKYTSIFHTRIVNMQWNVCYNRKSPLIRIDNTSHNTAIGVIRRTTRTKGANNHDQSRAEIWLGFRIGLWYFSVDHFFYPSSKIDFLL